ncbi:MAG: class I adenylate-forming enzyme family protein [Pseudomonadota bacterium]
MSWFHPEPLLLPDMLALNAQQRASQPAVTVGDTTLDWGSFGRECARFASAVHNAGLTPGDRVGVVMNNALDTLIAVFGSIYGGYVVVPINVSVADDALATMLSDSGARAVICNGEHTARVHALRARLAITLWVATEPHEGWELFSQWLSAANMDHAPARVSPSDYCNIIYSSGTTGLPKGIVHDHRCRSAWAYDMAVALRYHPGARTLCSLGLYSNISWVAMLSTVLAGGSLIVMPAFDVAACLALIAEQRITHTTMVPVQLQRILAHPAFDAAAVASLQSLMCCGSPLAPATKQQVVDAFGGAFLELYGLTEGLVSVLQPEDMATKIRSVGRPSPGQHIVILDNDDNACPPGVSGEIVGRGPLQMAGYHQRDDANQDATWVDAEGVRWLRTGDIGMFDEAGYLYLVDRKKDMIISGGQNIYPADIEAVLIEQPEIDEVAVIGVASERWGETPIAVVVGDVADEQALMSTVNSRLGKQQRIAAVRCVDALPRNPNGKVLKRELRTRFSDVTL